MTILAPKLPLGRNVDSDVVRSLQMLAEYINELALGGNGLAENLANNSSLVAAIAEGVDPTLDLTQPDQPTGFTVTGAFSTIMVEWDESQSSNFSYAEVLRHTSDDIGSSVVVGTTSSTIFSDQPFANSLSQTYYYWVRFISQNNVPGPYNATAGTPGSTADDPEYVLEVLSSNKWEPGANYVVDNIATPIIPDGKALTVQSITTGISGGTEPVWPAVIGNTVVDGGVTWELVADDVSLEALIKPALVDGSWAIALKEAFIADATITNAKIKNLAVDTAKITDLAVATAKIATAAITEAKIDDLAVTTAKIGTAAITTAKIGTAQVDTLTVAGSAITSNFVTLQSGSFTSNTSTWQVICSTPTYSSGIPAGTEVLITFTVELATLENPGEIHDIMRIVVNGSEVKRGTQRHNVSGGTFYGTVSHTLNYVYTMPGTSIQVYTSCISGGVAGQDVIQNGTLTITACKR